MVRCECLLLLLAVSMYQAERAVLVGAKVLKKAPTHNSEINHLEEVFCFTLEPVKAGVSRTSCATAIGMRDFTLTPL